MRNIVSKKIGRGLLLGTVLVLTAGTGSAANDDLAAAGALLRDHQLQDLAGRPTSLATFRGEIVVVNFWASWCGTCQHELPVLDAWNTDWRGRGARVVAISIDKQARNASRFLGETELGLTAWYDGTDCLAVQLNLSAVPTSYVLDRLGRVVLRIEGSSEADLKRMHDTVQDLLARDDGRPGA